MAISSDRSIHNVRIEHLWVDVTAQVGSKWADFFTLLEPSHGFNINNEAHVWLLHHIFLSRLNQELAFFADSWNHHRIQIRDGPNRSPADMFGFDMLVRGVWGEQVADEVTGEELEVYGVDWEALVDDRFLHSRETNNLTDEGWSSWLGNNGPPNHLNMVEVEPPAGPHEADVIAGL